MDSCVLCLEVAIGSLPCIYIDSNEWQKCNIKCIIEKHLWWWHLEQSSKRCSYICGQCWEMLSSFHAFYLNVKKVHQEYDARKWPVLKGKSNTQELHTKSKINGKNCTNIANTNRTKPLKFSKSVEKRNGSDDNASTLNRKKSLTKAETTRQYEDYLARSGYQFYCDICNISLICFMELKSHYRQEHDVSGYALCCNKKFYNRGQFTDHLMVHENPNYFKCSFCNKVLCHRLSYENHLKCHDLSIEQMYVCDECKKPFCEKDDYDQHILLHGLDDVVTKSTNVFQDPANISVTNNESMISSKNNNEAFYNTFIDERDDNIGIDVEATNYDQSLTNISQNFSVDVFQHNQTKGGLPVVKSENVTCFENVGQIFPDDYADGQFGPTLNTGQNNNLNILENSTTNEFSCIGNSQGVICSENGEIFNYTFIEESSNIETQGCELAIKRIYCDICNEKFCDKIALYRHQNEIHPKEMRKEQICAYCSKVSPNMQAHRAHIRYNHTKGLKHACHLCEKKFSRPFNLREHLSTHTGVPLHACPYCSRPFKSKANMHTHRKKVHPKEWQEGRQKQLAAQNNRWRKNRNKKINV